MPANVPVETPKPAAHAVEKRPALQAAPPERSSTTYKKADVITPTGREINESFSVQSRTEKDLAERVQNFVAVLQDNRLSTIAAEPWQQDFIKQFQARFPNYDPAKIKDYATEFVRTNEGLVAALKIAEWELATIQQATGAYITDVQRPNQRYHALMQTAGREASVLPDRSRMQRFFHTNRAESEEAAKADVKTISHRTIREKDGNYYFRIGVGGNERVGCIGLAEQVAYDGAQLDAAQRAFLLKQGKLENLQNGQLGRQYAGQDAETERQQIADLVTLLSQARVDVRQATGGSVIELNTIDRQRGLLNSGNPHLRVEEQVLLNNTNRLDIRAASQREIERVVADMQTRVTEEANKRRTTEQNQQIVNAVKTQEAELEKTRGQTPAEAQRVKDLQASVPKLEADLTTARRPGEIADRITNLNRRITVVNTEIDRLAHAAGYPAGTSLVTELQRIDPHGDLTIERNRWRTERDTRVANRDRIREQQRNERNPAQRGVYQGQIDTINAELTTAYPGLAGGIEAEVARLELQIGTIEGMRDREDIQPLIEEAKRLRTTVGQENKNRLDAEGQRNDLMDRINAGPPPRATRLTRTTLAGDIDTRLRNQREELQRLELTAIGRARQGEVLTTFRTRILEGQDPDDTRTENRRTAREGITARAQRAMLLPTDADYLPLVNSADYVAYPPNYLRALQIVFGNDVVRAGNEAQFQEVSRLLTPEMITRIYNERNNTTINDIAGLPNGALTPALITAVVQGMEAEAVTGRLGRLSDQATEPTAITRQPRPRHPVATRSLEDSQAAIRPQYERIALVHRDAAFDPNAPAPAGGGVDNAAERDRLAAVIYHYEDLDDLTRRIVTNWNVAGWPGNAAVPAGADYFANNAAGQAAVAQAKRFAEEIDRTREWKRKLHAQSSGTEPTTT